MTTLDLHPWNFMPTEVLAHVFSFLPVRDRHNVSRMCTLWASAVSFASVWRFTEIQCNADKTEEGEDGNTSGNLLQEIQPYICHIRYLKLVLDVSLELNRRLTCIILDVMAQKSSRLQGLQIMCYGKSPRFYSGQDVLQSLGQLFQGMDEVTIQHVDLRQMPFALDNGTISLVGSCSPNLRTLLINNRSLTTLRRETTMLRRETIVEVVRACPRLSTLGVSYFVLSPKVFQELLRPSREPFKYLELFYDGLHNHIPLGCWISMRDRHPGFRIGLEFAASVTVRKMHQVLYSYMPISQLHFNAFNPLANPMTLVLQFYAGTLERLVLHSAPCIELNMVLRKVAIFCPILKEIHCFCVVGLGVAEVFRNYCPHLKKYTLSHRPFFPDNPPTVVL